MPNLYAFIDESGNHDFSDQGTKYLVFTSLLTSDISPGASELYKLKYDLIAQGVDLEYFHASEDRQIVRDQVLQVIGGLTNIRIDSVVVRKPFTSPKIRALDKFYPMMVENLLKYPFDQRGLGVSKYDKVFIFLDREGSTTKTREVLKKALKNNLRKHIGNVPYEIMMHQSNSHPYLQIVDYCSWAIYVKWEKKERRPYKIIKNQIKSEFDIFSGGSTKWY